jgi:hypothetical protein
MRDHLLRLERDDPCCASAATRAPPGSLDWNRGLIVGYVPGGKVRGIGELR